MCYKNSPPTTSVISSVDHKLLVNIALPFRWLLLASAASCQPSWRRSGPNAPRSGIGVSTLSASLSTRECGDRPSARRLYRPRYSSRGRTRLVVTPRDVAANGPQLAPSLEGIPKSHHTPSLSRLRYPPVPMPSQADLSKETRLRRFARHTVSSLEKMLAASLPR